MITDNSVVKARGGVGAGLRRGGSGKKGGICNTINNKDFKNDGAKVLSQINTI